MDIDAMLKSVMVDPVTWVEGIQTLIGPTSALNLTGSGGTMYKLGIILLIAGVVWSGLKIASVGSGTELKDFFVRLLLAASLVFGSPGIGTSLNDFWKETYKWGRTNVAGKAIANAQEQVTSLAVATSAISLLAAAAPVALEVANTVIFQKNAKEAMQDAEKSVAGSMDTIGKVLQFLGGSLSAIMGSYYLVILVAGFTILMATVLLPISGAMMMFSGGLTNQWFSAWFRGVTGALIMTIFMPVVFSSALELGFVQPAKNFAEGFSAAAAESQAGLKSITEIPGNLGSGKFLEAMQNMYSGVSGQVSAAGKAIQAATVGLAASIIMLVIGLIFAVAIVYVAQNQIMTLVGGTFSGGREGGAAGAAAFGAAGTAAGTMAGSAGSVIGGAAVTTANAFTGGGASKAISVFREAGGGGGSSSPGGGGFSMPSGSGSDDSHYEQMAQAAEMAESAWSGGGSSSGGAAKMRTSSGGAGSGFGSSNLKSGGGRGSSAPGGTSGRSFGSGRGSGGRKS